VRCDRPPLLICWKQTERPKRLVSNLHRALYDLLEPTEIALRKALTEGVEDREKPAPWSPVDLMQCRSLSKPAFRPLRSAFAGPFCFGILSGFS